MNWFAVHTNTRAETTVDRQLRQTGFQTLYLHYHDIVNHARRQASIIKPYFPRYLFAQVIAPQSVGQIGRTQGVTAVVCAGDEPLQVPPSVIDELRARADHNGLVQMSGKEREARRRWLEGQQVRIREGVFAGLLATVELDTGDQIRLWLDMFRGRVRADLRPDQVSPALRSLS